MPIVNEPFIPETTLLKFIRSRGIFRTHDGVSPITEILERSLNKWFNKLSISYQELLSEYVSRMARLPIRLRADTAMIRVSEFTIGEDCRHGHLGLIDISAGLTARAYHADSQEKMDDIVGQRAYIC